MNFNLLQLYEFIQYKIYKATYLLLYTEHSWSAQCVRIYKNFLTYSQIESFIFGYFISWVTLLMLKIMGRSRGGGFLGKPYNIEL